MIDCYPALSELDEKEMKSLLLATQTVINSHFFYNTLSAISGLAMLGRCDDVIFCCNCFAKLLRYVTDDADAHVSISSEVEHSRCYLDLMKVRYDTGFQYSIDVAGDSQDKSIPKLLIYSICEFVFSQVFSRMEQPYLLDIQVDGDSIRTWVRIAFNGNVSADEFLTRWQESNHDHSCYCISADAPLLATISVTI